MRKLSHIVLFSLAKIDRIISYATKKYKILVLHLVYSKSYENFIKILGANMKAYRISQRVETEMGLGSGQNRVGWLGFEAEKRLSLRKLSHIVIFYLAKIDRNISYATKKYIILVLHLVYLKSYEKVIKFWVLT